MQEEEEAAAADGEEASGREKREGEVDEQRKETEEMNCVGL